MWGAERPNPQAGRRGEMTWRCRASAAALPNSGRQRAGFGTARMSILEIPLQGTAAPLSRPGLTDPWRQER